MSTETKHSPTPIPWKFQEDPGAGIHLYGPVPFSANCAEFTLKAADQRLFTLPDLRTGTARLSHPEGYPSLAYEQWIQFPTKEWDEMQRANAEFICRAVNSHDALVSACAVALLCVINRADDRELEYQLHAALKLAKGMA